MNSFGVALALIGGALSALFACVGSAIGVGRTGQAAAGVISENPSMFTKVLILQLLPGTQGIFGFVVTFMIFINCGIFGGSAEMSLAKGLLYLTACLPMAIIGYFSAIGQAGTAVSSIQLVAKHPEQFGKAMILPAMVETYAIFGLLISLLAIVNIGKLPV